MKQKKTADRKSAIHSAKLNERKKNGFSFKEEYKESFDFLKKTKPFIFAIIILFFIFVLIGFFVPAPSYLIEKISEFVRELSLKTENMSVFELIRFILFNNLQVSFFGMILGVFFGIIPVIFAVANGYILGFIFAVSVKAAGIGVLWRILPHGIFELPAIFISLGLGLKFGSLIIRRKIKELKDFFWKALKVFFLIIVPLLIIAGIIEGILVYYLK